MAGRANVSKSSKGSSCCNTSSLFLSLQSKVYGAMLLCAQHARGRYGSCAGL